MAEQVSYIPYYNVFPVPEKVFIETFLERARGMSQIKEHGTATHYFGCIDHGILEAYPLVPAPSRSEDADQLRPCGQILVRIAYCRTVSEEILGADFFYKYEVIIHQQEMLAQVGDVPYQGLDRPGVESGEICLMTAENHLMINDFHGDMTLREHFFHGLFQPRVLIVGHYENLSYEAGEEVDGADAVEDLPDAVEAAVTAYILEAHLALVSHEFLPFRPVGRVITVDPWDDYVNGKARRPLVSVA